MSDDKDRRTLEPTPKRVEDFRKRGEIALSRDLTALCTLAGGTTCALGWSGSSSRAVGEMMQRYLDGTDRLALSQALPGAVSTLLMAALPTFVGALAGCLISIGLQQGWPPALKGPKFDLSRTFSLGGLGPLVSPKQAGGRALKALAKVGFVALACAMAARDEHRRFLDGPSLEAISLGAHLGGTVGRLFFRAGVPLAILAGLDYWIARRAINAKMRMTHDEMKREHREQEGDPQIKRARRRRMRELAKRRLETTVKTADVVLVNPTEYAVALRYKNGEDRAPRVVAKGRGIIAERIRELARKAGVPILSEPPLTRLIHKTVPEGREIPASLFHAVAEVLAYIYRLRGRRS